MGGWNPRRRPWGIGKNKTPYGNGMEYDDKVLSHGNREVGESKGMKMGMMTQGKGSKDKTS